eukprot:2453960-Lingulodinium_polyedra.AAC.1
MCETLRGKYKEEGRAMPVCVFQTVCKMHRRRWLGFSDATNAMWNAKALELRNEKEDSLRETEQGVLAALM